MISQAWRGKRYRVRLHGKREYYADVDVWFAPGEPGDADDAVDKAKLMAKEGLVEWLEHNEHSGVSIEYIDVERC